ncbi:MAG TPA: hypothetical protein DCL74_02435 [Succinivibrionaceae bacterium]|nr:hypothetical protein [Succinivibrionaceae bacterium]
MYELTDKEHDAVLQLNAEYRKSYFINKALEQGGFYIISDQDGPFMLEDLETDEHDEKATVLPVFAHEIFANDFIAKSKLYGAKAQYVTVDAYNRMWVETLKNSEVLVAFMPVGEGDFEISAPEPWLAVTKG